MSTHPAEQATPTAERPESGTIGSAGVPLFTVEHWLEDGDHVFRSTEFDMTIGAPDIGAAAGQVHRERLRSLGLHGGAAEPDRGRAAARQPARVSVSSAARGA